MAKTETWILIGWQILFLPKCRVGKSLFGFLCESLTVALFKESDFEQNSEEQKSETGETGQNEMPTKIQSGSLLVARTQ